MEPLAVVKDFALFKEGGDGFSLDRKLTALHEFLFEAAAEIFHQGVIPVCQACRVEPAVEPVRHPHPPTG